MVQYGSEILAARSKRRINQGDLAKEAGLYVQTLVDIENNRLGIDDETYRRLLDAIDSIVAGDSSEAAA